MLDIVLNFQKFGLNCNQRYYLDQYQIDFRDWHIRIYLRQDIAILNGSLDEGNSC